MSTNPPQPQGQDFEEASTLGAKPPVDKTKIKNEGVPVDSALTGIPIVLLGKDKALGDQVIAFLRPDYETIHTYNSVESFMSALPGLTEPRPKAIFMGMGFSQDEQDEVEKKVTDIKVVKSRPGNKELSEKFKDLDIADKAPRITKALLDAVRGEMVHMTETAKAVTANAV